MLVYNILSILRILSFINFITFLNKPLFFVQLENGILNEFVHNQEISLKVQ
jgi:hypothetical protein